MFWIKLGIDVFLEVAFEIADTDRTAVFLDREEVVALHIPVLKLQPPPEYDFCFRREVYSPVFSAFGFFCSEIDSLSGKLQICDQQGRAFAQSHTTVQHEDGHNIIPVFCEIGFIKFGSRVDIYLPLDSEIFAKLGDKTVGGITEIARLK